MLAKQLHGVRLLRLASGEALLIKSDVGICNVIQINPPDKRLSKTAFHFFVLTKMVRRLVNSESERMQKKQIVT